MRNAIAICAMLAVAGSLALKAVAADKADGDKPKYTIKQVMKDVHAGKESVLKKVIAGKASDAEKEKLLEMYQSLAKSKPPQGDAASWKAKTEALVAAAQAEVDGAEGAGAKLEKAANCGACHGVHKPKKN